MDISKLKKIKIDHKLVPRDYFQKEYEHLKSLGLKNSPGVSLDVDGVHEGRLYFDNKDILQSVMSDLKKLGVVPVIECQLTRIVIYKTDQASILYYYLKGREVSCQGVFSRSSRKN